MTRQIPWLRIFVEGVVIVGSILLAFGIDAWWARRQDRAQEEQILLNLHDEFVANRSDLVEQLGRTGQMIVNSQRLLRWSHGGAAALPPDSLRQVLQSVLQPPTFEAQLGVVTEILNAGDLHLIQSDELRGSIAAWPDLYRDAVDREPWEHVVVHEQLRPFLGRLIELPPLREQVGAWENPERIYGAFSAQVLHDTEFLSLAATRLDWAVIVFDNKNNFLDALDQVLGLLDRELAARGLTPRSKPQNLSVPELEALIGG